MRKKLCKLYSDPFKLLYLLISLLLGSLLIVISSNIKLIFIVTNKTNNLAKIKL